MDEAGHYPQSSLADLNDEPTTSEASRSAIMADGEHINQEFNNCSVNVVGRDVIQGNKITNINIHVAAPVQEIDDYLIKTINQETKRKTSVCILNDFRYDGLCEPSFAAYPQMRRIRAKDYYKGRYGVRITEDIVSPVDQLADEVGFKPQNEYQHESIITIDDVMAWIWQEGELPPNEEASIISIIASAGSGKTTLLRRIAQKALDVPPEMKQLKIRPKMVHYIELKDIREKESIKTSNFLFNGRYSSEAEEQQAFAWLIKNQTDVILLFDGLDQAKWEFHGQNIRSISNFESASTSTIMYNILSRNILPHVTIFITSREFKISELPAEARPRIIITMEGLTTDDAKRLFIFLIGDNGEELWEKIETMSPRLLHLISVPVFLILTAIMMGNDPTRDPPSTVTELYTRIISGLQSVENIRNREEIFAILKKLKAMAFTGMMNGRVMFQQTDLMQFEITADQVQDLMTKVPGNNLLSRYLLESDFNFYFCHQSIQEFLAAIFVAELPVDDFSDFDDTHLHDERWSVVRRFVVGIVFSKSTNDLYRVSDPKKKHDILSRSIRSQLEKKWMDSRTSMELFTVIYESNDDYLMRSISVIDVRGAMSSREQAHIIKTLATRCGDLESLDLSHNEVADRYLESITKSLKNRNEATFNEGANSNVSMKPPFFGEVNLSGRSFAAADIRSLLGFQSKTLCENIDWRVLKFYSLKMVKEGSVIEIIDKESGHDYLDIPVLVFGEQQETEHCVEGSYNMEESKLIFRKITALDKMQSVLEMMEPKLIEMPDEYIYVEQDILRDMSELNMKVKKMVIRITSDESIDWSMIADSVTKYQVEYLDIAVDGETSVDEYEDILQHVNDISNLSIEINIHSLFFVKYMDDINSVYESCQQNKIESVRCLISHFLPQDTTNHDLRLVNNAKKLALVFGCKIDNNDDGFLDEYLDSSYYKFIGLRHAKRIPSGRSVAVIDSNRVTRDAWWEVDDRCCREEFMKMVKFDAELGLDHCTTDTDSDPDSDTDSNSDSQI